MSDDVRPEDERPEGVEPEPERDHPAADPEAQTAAEADRRADELFARAEPSDAAASPTAEASPAEAASEEPTAAATPATPPQIVLSPPSIFRDRDLTPIEQTRMAVSSAQPKPWEPSDTDLDPSSDAGWERAAGHELIAVRPEDVAVQPSPPPIGPDGSVTATAPGVPVAPPPTAPAPGPGDEGFHALPTYDPNAATQRYVAPATSALAWAKGGAPGVPSNAPQAASDTAAATSAPFTPFTPAASPLLTPVPNSPQLAAAGAAAASAPAGASGAPAVAEAVAAPAPRRRPWAGLGTRTRSGVRTVTRPLMLVALFVLGILLGSTYWTRAQPAPQTAETVPAATHEPGTTSAVPPQIQSLIAALQADDQSQIQLVVPADPYRLLAGELAGDGFTRIVGATALTTYAVGPDSATEILITGDDAQGNQGTINLVVHLHNGQISDFR